jgi:hypothetical protein
MNTLLLVVLASCPPGGDGCGCQQAPAPVAASPDAVPAPSNSSYQGAPSDSSHQGRPRFFGWLRGQHHNTRRPPAENGHADGDWTPVAAAPALGTVPVVEVATPEPVPTVVAPPTAAAQAPRLVPRPQLAPTTAEPPLAAPPDGAPRPMPRGAAVMTNAAPPSN